MRTLKTLFVTASLLFVIGFMGPGCKSKDPAPDPATQAECTCATEGDVWCEKCGKGKVGGEEVTCQGCYGEKTGGPACETCKKE